jgi:hypothetical protein
MSGWSTGHGARSGIVTPGGGGGGPDPDPTARFAGDPGVGNFYFGGKPDTLSSERPPGYSSHNAAFAGWQSKMEPEAGGKPMGISRLYLSGSQTAGWTGGDTSLIATNTAAGRLSHISFKYPTGGAWGSTTASQMNKALLFDAAWDEWMDNLAQRFDDLAPMPVWWTFFHEPEDHRSVTGGGAGYRAVQRRMKQDLDALGVTNGAFVAGCIVAPYDYGRAFGPTDWNLWYPDWKGTYTGGSTAASPNPADYYLHGDPNSVVDIIGLDVYNFWNAERYKEEDPANYANGSSAESLSTYVTFENMWNTIAGMNDFLGKPYCLGEYGVEAYHTGCYVPPGAGTVTKYNSSTPNLNPPGDAVFGTTNNNRTRSNIEDMGLGLADWNIVAVEVYNYRLTHDPWRLEYADPDQIRYSAYGNMVGQSNCVIPDLTP